MPALQPKSLSDDEAELLALELIQNLAEALSTTATNWLCTRPDRHPERGHLLSLLVDMVCDANTHREVIQRALAHEERVFHPDEYAEAEARLNEVRGLA
jgi:hypothetical protein